MDDEGFWRLIAVLGLSETELPGPTDDDKEGLVAPLIVALTASSASEIEEFDGVLAQKLYAIDTEAHWRAYGSPSQDGFLYARCWVVARGHDFYEEVSADPTKMPRWLDKRLEESMNDGSLSIEEMRTVPSADLEPLLYASREAYEAKTGAEFAPTRSVSFETGSNRAEHPNRPW